MRLRGPYSEAHTAFYEHIDKYIQIKDNESSVSVSGAQESHIRYSLRVMRSPTNMWIWLFALDAAGEATLPQTLAINKLVLEMVVDNNGFPNEDNPASETIGSTR